VSEKTILFSNEPGIFQCHLKNIKWKTVNVFMSLYIVPTPIGNLEDITLRALRVLKEADLIACEDTRHTRKLLDHFGIKTPTISYHEHNEKSRTTELIERLKKGQEVALVTDAGTPGISDPAYRIVLAAIEHEIAIVPLPGATALIGGLVASGLPLDSFLFVGFLSHKKNARLAKLSELKSQSATLVFYEAPHRIRYTLTDALSVLGNRQAVLARELTKLHEQFIRGTLAEMIAYFAEHEPRGEMTLVIAGSTEDNLISVDLISIEEQVEMIMREEGLSRNEAIKQAARSRGMSKREAYQILLDKKEE
jgi:16S rRNA (cytidine1402-2'-O)-methyltransferase